MTLPSDNAADPPRDGIVTRSHYARMGEAEQVDMAKARTVELDSALRTPPEAEQR